MDAEQIDGNAIQVKQFREILIWPLQIESPRHCAPAQNGSENWYLECVRHFESACGWQETDLIDRETARSKITQYAEFVYFHPFVQRFLYNTDQKDCPKKTERIPGLHVFRRGDIKKVGIKLNPVSLDLELDVDRVHLYLFEMGVALLVVEISYDADHDPSAPLSLSQAHNILDSFRRVYPPYWESGHPGHCPDEVTWILDTGERASANYQEMNCLIHFVTDTLAPPVSAHWQYLLEPMVPFRSINSRARYCYRQIGDERIPLMAYVAIDDPRSITGGDWVRLAFADDCGDSRAFPYSPDFLRDFEGRHCYDRYWYNPPGGRIRTGYEWMNTRYLCAGYSFVMVGQTGSKFFSDDETGGLAHFRHHYFQMGLIVHFHKAALLVLSNRLSKAVESFSESADLRDLKDFNEQVERILRDFLHFSQRYWFQEISNQTQAIDLFEWWSQHLRVRELFEFVRREARDINDYLDVIEEQRAANTTVRLTVVASSGFIFTLIAGFMGMNIFKETDPLGLWFLAFSLLAFLLVVSTVLISDRLSNLIADLANIQYPPRKRLTNAFRKFFSPKAKNF